MQEKEQNLHDKVGARDRELAKADINKLYEQIQGDLDGKNDWMR